MAGTAKKPNNRGFGAGNFTISFSPKSLSSEGNASRRVFFQKNIASIELSFERKSTKPCQRNLVPSRDSSNLKTRLSYSVRKGSGLRSSTFLYYSAALA